VLQLAAAVPAQVLLGLLRLLISAVGLALAFAAGASSTPALAAFALGLFGFVVSISSAERVFAAPNPGPAPAHTREPAVVTLLAAAWPSTIGVAILLAIALGVNATLAALVAGVEAGMGAAALLSAARIRASEREVGARLLFDRRDRRTYLEPR
jgi:hypothetical protein